MQQQTQCPLPTLGPFPACAEVGPPACQVHLPWKERRRRGMLGAAPPSTATQSRARPGIMAAASARPIPAAQGAQGSAGVCGGALSHPGLCPGIWKRRSCSEGEGGRLGGVPRDQITAPRGKRLGGRIPLASPPLPWRVPCLATITDTPTLGTPSGSTPHWQAPAPPRHPPQ